MNTTATLDLLPAQSIASMPDRFFGSFVEHLGRCVHGGTSPNTPALHSLAAMIRFSDTSPWAGFSKPWPLRTKTIIER